jgi:crotonobetainyl-CoA:carnitine CoA-transferase CaiB-like acyl-CoA transferase
MPIADMYSGIHGVAGVCAALLGRVATGKGRHVDIALLDCMVSMHDFAVQCYTVAGEIPQRSGSDLPQATVYGVFAARDGDVVIAAQVDDGWRRLAGVIGGTELANDSRYQTSEGRNAHNKDLLARVRAWVEAQPSAAAVLSALKAVDVPCALVQRIDQVLADPQVIARNMIVEQDHPVLGRVKLANVPFKFSDCDASVRTAAPLLGQHNKEVARSLGMSADAIEEYEREGVFYADEMVAKLCA